MGRFVYYVEQSQRTELINEEGWTRHPDDGYSIDRSYSIDRDELNYPFGDLKSMHPEAHNCPQCGSEVRPHHYIQVHRDEKGNITHRTGKHDCGVNITVIGE